MSGVFVVAGGECTNCVDEGPAALNRWTMPLLKLGEKRYYLGIFFKVSGQHFGCRGQSAPFSPY